jgi:hypothetical protein
MIVKVRLELVEYVRKTPKGLPLLLSLTLLD